MMPTTTKAVYKFPIPMKGSCFSLMLPKGWKFLSVIVNDNPCGVRPHLWAECVDGMAKEQVDFALFGTGQEIPMTATYLTSYVVGPFNYHLYKLN